MNESKLPHAISSFVISMLSAGYAWFEHYGASVATVIAIIAGLYSIAAGRATLKLRKKQSDQMDDV